MRTNVDLNDKLIEEAFALTGARTKKELLHLALQELVRVRRKQDLTEHGVGGVNDLLGEVGEGLAPYALT